MGSLTREVYRELSLGCTPGKKEGGAGRSWWAFRVAPGRESDHTLIRGRTLQQGEAPRGDLQLQWASGNQPPQQLGDKVLQGSQAHHNATSTITDEHNERYIQWVPSLAAQSHNWESCHVPETQYVTTGHISEYVQREAPRGRCELTYRTSFHWPHTTVFCGCLPPCTLSAKSSSHHGHPHNLSMRGSANHHPRAKSSLQPVFRGQAALDRRQAQS